jgi:hypothetical protein
MLGVWRIYLELNPAEDGVPGVGGILLEGGLGESTKTLRRAGFHTCPMDSD